MIKEVKKNKKIFSTLIVLSVMFGTIFIGEYFLGDNVKATETSQFLYYKEITLESDMVNGTSDLNNFPYLINLISDPQLANNVLDNADDIAFFDESNNQLAHEIEMWNHVTGKLVVWVNVTTLKHDSDTSIYMYYGDSDIGASAQNPTGVWDSGYVGVWHMNGSSATAIDDSTSNNNDVTSDSGDPTYNTAGDFGYAVNFDSDDYLVVPHDASLNISDSCTFEAYYDADSSWAGTGGHGMFSKSNIGTLDLITMNWGDAQDSWYQYTNDENYHVMSGKNLVPSGWNHIGIRVVASSTDSEIFHSGCKTMFQQVSNAVAPNSYDLHIGAHNGDGLVGDIEELRWSKWLRSESYLLTSYNVMNNDTNGSAFTVGSQTSSASPPSSSTMSSTSLTVQGETGDTVLTNETGDAYQTAKWSFHYNGTWTVDYLRVNVSDIDANITADNVYLQFTSDNASWDKGGTWKNGASGGWSFIINDTTFTNANGCYGVDPFPIDDNTSYVYMRVKVTIPAGIGNETYLNSAMTWDSGRYDVV